MFCRTMGLGFCSVALHLLLLFVLGHAFSCDEKTHFKCGSGQCVTANWRCDGQVDCSDGTDEKDCSPRSCKPRQFTCGGGECLPQRWVCDGDVDCPDRSDEAPAICSKKSCPPTDFACGGAVSIQCIPKAWLCDGEEDCRNGADEIDCAKPTCSPDEIMCSDGQCLARHFLCNGQTDCVDGSDEEGCPPTTCNPPKVACDSGQCIPASWRCDGEPDCLDGSDENPLLCPTKSTKAKAVCPSGEVLCTSGECIHEGWWCDGREDCHDGSDEHNCTAIVCGAAKITCGDGKCVPLALACDGISNCNDGADETGCSIEEPACDTTTNFMCANGVCLPSTAICNGKNDCGDWSDEPAGQCGVDECLNDNGGCSSLCVDEPIGYRCECRPGFELEDQYTCRDIDECQILGTCSQLCMNFKGGFKCQCHDGYKLDPKTGTCKAIGTRSFILFTTHHDIRRLVTSHNEYTLLVTGAHKVVALTTDVARSLIYWFDFDIKSILSSPMNTGSQGVKADQAKVFLSGNKVPGGLQAVEGLAWDWQHDLLFWTDSREKILAVAAPFNDGNSKTLVASGIKEPMDVAVDPQNGWVYWSDWGNPARIERIGMDGTARTAVVTTEIEWPNGIALDLEAGRIYWVDSKLQLVATVTTEGADRRTIIKSEALLQPFALSLFEDTLYWTDGEREAIYSMNKFTAMDRKVLVSGLNRPQDIVVVHPLLQKPGSRRCKKNKCSYLCLPSPRLGKDLESTYSCACPDHTFVAADGRTCTMATNIPSLWFLTSARPLLPTLLQSTGKLAPPPPAYIPTPTPTMTSTMKVETTLAPVRKVVPKPPHKPPRISFHPIPRTELPPPMIQPVTFADVNSLHLTSPAESALQGSVDNTSAVAAAVIVTLLLILACGAGFYIFRNWQLQEVKTMRFENPVYRKTTDDDDELEIDRSPTVGHTYPAGTTAEEIELLQHMKESNSSTSLSSDTC
uniref:LDL receptor related protein 8 n=1 Tax=Eptatretus burgeri TaxID=7764 RepID=A0A8C4QZU1_EPTBU